MARINLTAGRVRDFTTDEGQSFLWDTDAPGLAVRATAPGKRKPEGGKAYIFQGKLKGCDLRVTIGDVRAWSLADARKEARRLQGQVDQGVDPRQEKQERIEAAAAKAAATRKAKTPALEAWRAYIAARAPSWSPRHLADHEAAVSEGGQPRTRGRRPGEPDVTLPGALRGMMQLPLHQIDADRVKAWLADEAAHRPTHAALTFRLLRAFLNWCAFHPDYRGQVHMDACAGRIAKDTLPKKSAKTDSLQREQLPTWFAAVRQIGNPVIAAYLQVLLLTGARREELAGLRWEDVDFQWSSLTIHDKVEGERIIPLTPFVAHLLTSLPRRNQWVFSATTGATGRLQEPRIAHNRALAAAGLPALSIHGLRRSFGSLVEWVECPAGIAAQIMGHKPSATAEKHYRVRPLDLLRSWHVKIEAWILEQAGIDFVPAEQPGALRVVKV
jgi:integrase